MKKIKKKMITETVENDDLCCNAAASSLNEKNSALGDYSNGYSSTETLV